MGYALKHFKDVAGSVGLLPGAVSFLKENVGRGKYNEDMLFHTPGIGLNLYLYAQMGPRCEEDVAFTLARFAHGASGEPFLGHPNFTPEQFLQIIDSFKDVQNKIFALSSCGAIKSLAQEGSGYRLQFVTLLLNLSDEDCRTFVETTFSDSDALALEKIKMHFLESKLAQKPATDHQEESPVPQ